MASLETFETTLKEVVQAKRLSASKMAKLTEIAMKSMQDDTQLVSILYRMHKALAPSQKVSSLYVFDALLRAARSQVVKHGITTPPESSSGKGNAATFLSKVEGVVDSLFEDMISTGNSEAKEKTRKILDIWVKSNTLPSGVLNRLGDIIKDTKAESKDKEPPEKINPIDPRNHLSPPSITPPIASNVTTPPQTSATVPNVTPATVLSTATPGMATDALQSTLLALLNQAANTTPNGGNSQIGTNTALGAGAGSVNTAGLDVNQLALLQQWTQSVKVGGPPTGGSTGGNFGPQHVPQPSTMNTGGRNGDSFAGPSTSRHPHGLTYQEGVSQPAYGSARHGGGRGGGGSYGDGHLDDRRDNRGFGRGGRGGRGRGRWGEGDDRHHSWDHRSPRDRGGEWGSRSPQASLPPPLMSRGRNNRSRSRSPPPRNRIGGGSGRRDPRPYSPPGRSAILTTHRNGNGATEEEKDEFGRDIRPMSVDGDDEPPAAANSSSAPSTSSGLPSENQAEMVGAPIPTYEEPNPSSGGVNIRSMNSGRMGAAIPPVQSLPIATYESRDVEGGGGLQDFDFTKFEFTSPASWEALGKAWQTTNGYFPSQEELFQLVMMSSGVASISGGIGVGAEEGISGTEQDGNEPWQKDKGTSSQVRTWNHGRKEEDAYGTSVDSWDVSAKSDDTQVDQNQAVPALVDGSVGSSGKMQKVGDRWVFVRS